MAKGDKTDFPVIDPIQHNGKRYEVGSTIKLSEDEAAPLIAAGAIPAPEAEAQAQ